MTFLTDGTGSGARAKITTDNRLEVDAINRGENLASTKQGNSFNFNTGLVTLTTAGESGVMYIKNNEDFDISIDSVIVILGPSTGGSATDSTQVRFYRNPTTGTLISNATNVDDNENRNFGSGTILTADAFKGAEGNTITNGSVIIESLISPGNRVPFPVDLILTKGDTLAVSYEPNDSNTSMKTMTAFITHKSRPL